MNTYLIRSVRNILIVSLFLVLGCGSVVYASHVFKPWQDEVFVAIGREYGPAAEKRFRALMDIILANHDKSVMEKLKLTNDTLNNIPWIADPDIWKREDYWATPFETLATFGGDCEDIAIAKYAMLVLLGIPDENLGFAYVVNRNQEKHMLLIYSENEESPVYVLDNEVPEVLTAEERRDFVAIYVFQDDGTLYVIDDDGKRRSVKKVFKGRRFEKWLTVKEREKESLKKYEKYNGGRSLLLGD